jgi:hypothetical protein
VVLGGKGKAADHVVDTVGIFDASTDTWSSLPPMSTKREAYKDPAVGVSGDKIKLLVAGGKSNEGKHSLKSAECYDMKEKKWFALPNMIAPRSQTAGVFLADGVTFIVSGGFDEARVERLATCEQYNLITNVWTPVASLSKPFYGHCCVLYKNKPVVLGGECIRGWFSHFNPCEQYNAVSNKWSPFPSLGKVGAHLGAAVVQDKIYVVDPYVVQVFIGGSWTEIPPVKLQNPYSNTAVCLWNKLVVLGVDHKGNTVVKEFNPATGEWSDVPNLTSHCSQWFDFAVSF